MLDQYRNLTQEATTLESNNHSLETEAAQTKVQLSVTLDHVNDLERKIESQETMMRGYEKQVNFFMKGNRELNMLCVSKYYFW